MLVSQQVQQGKSCENKIVHHFFSFFLVLLPFGIFIRGVTMASEQCNKVPLYASNESQPLKYLSIFLSIQHAYPILKHPRKHSIFLSNTKALSQAFIVLNYYLCYLCNKHNMQKHYNQHSCAFAMCLMLGHLISTQQLMDCLQH